MSSSTDSEWTQVKSRKPVATYKYIVYLGEVKWVLFDLHGNDSAAREQHHQQFVDFVADAFPHVVAIETHYNKEKHSALSSVVVTVSIKIDEHARLQIENSINNFPFGKTILDRIEVFEQHANCDQLVAMALHNLQLGPSRSQFFICKPPVAKFVFSIQVYINVACTDGSRIIKLIRNNKTLKFAAPAGFVKHARDADLVTAAVREMDEELYGLFDTNLLDQLIRHAYSKRHYVFQSNSLTYNWRENQTDAGMLKFFIRIDPEDHGMCRIPGPTGTFDAAWRKNVVEWYRQRVISEGKYVAENCGIIFDKIYPHTGKKDNRDPDYMVYCMLRKVESAKK